MRTSEGNNDANGSLDKSVPYMRETYPEMRARLAREMAEHAAKDIAPEPDVPASAETEAWQW